VHAEKIAIPSILVFKYNSKYIFKVNDYKSFCKKRKGGYKISLN